MFSPMESMNACTVEPSLYKVPKGQELEAVIEVGGL